MRNFILGVGLLIAASAVHAEDKPILTVMTYDSFVSDWGPGPQIEERFEALCDCDLNFVAAGDGAALLAKLKLEGARGDADVVLGLDTNLTAEATATGLFATHGIGEAVLDLPVEWSDQTFLPYDWGYFAFVHNADMVDVPGDMKALGASDATIIIQDPRSSTPGLGLLMWVKAAYGDEAPAVWEALADNVVTVTPGWSEAYGLFLEGEADMVLSYTTSPAYHLIAEDDNSKMAAAFSEGHYLQVEVGGILKSSDQPVLAEEFLAFMVSEGFQSVIPTTNWMYPAVTPEAGLPEGFDSLIEVDKALLFSAEDARAIRGDALDEWLTALSQ
ncbi:thiamine ABC transporter substrate binding subunit [Rhodobacteraceae bacterium]|nr:thiamine ABC transporter substrate binding subunit [Paracoccaceae bacterium]